MTEHRSANDASDNVNNKLVINRFDELVTKYYVAHARQENIEKLAEHQGLTGKKNRNKMLKKDEYAGS